MENTLFIFGYGYSARALARVLEPQGWRVIGTSRDGQGDTIRWPGGEISHALSSATHLLISAGPDAEGDPVLRGAKDQIIATAPHLKWLGYLSTTGVYGDHAGDWVDEATPLSPATKRGQMRVAAEMPGRHWHKTTACRCISSVLPGFMAPDEDRLPKCGRGRRGGS